MTIPSGVLDIAVMSPPHTLAGAQTTLRALYDVARKESVLAQREQINVTVIVDGSQLRDVDGFWEVIYAGKLESHLLADFRYELSENPRRSSGTPNVILPMNDDVYTSRSGINTPTITEETPEEGEEEDVFEANHSIVAVGGTFDHLHDGHKLLLTASSFLTRDLLIVGLTGDKLLVNKKYSEAMQTYQQRSTNVRDFLKKIYPLLNISIVKINDIYGPTVENPDIEALVVSKETSAGAGQINHERRNKGWNLLKVYEIDVVGSSLGAKGMWKDKLSSTELRRIELESK